MKFAECEEWHAKPLRGGAPSWKFTRNAEWIEEIRGRT